MSTLIVATADNACAQTANDLATAISELAKKISDFTGDRTKLTDAVKGLDKALDPLRAKDDPVHLDRAIADLAAWLAQQKTTAQKAAAQAKLAPILSAIDALDFDKAKRLIRELVATITTGRFSEKELADLPKDDQFKPLSDALAKLSDQPTTIQIIKASYGDHRTGRTCDATAFFRARCNGLPKCLTDTEMGAGISGALLCGYEPAPMAAAGANAAVVHYNCGPIPVVPPARLQGKTQLVCP